MKQKFTLLLTFLALATFSFAQKSIVFIWFFFEQVQTQKRVGTTVEFGAV
jgi:hypothetical protein